MSRRDYTPPRFPWWAVALLTALALSAALTSCVGIGPVTSELDGSETPEIGTCYQMAMEVELIGHLWEAFNCTSGVLVLRPVVEEVPAPPLREETASS